MQRTRLDPGLEASARASLLRRLLVLGAAFAVSSCSSPAKDTPGTRDEADPTETNPAAPEGTSPSDPAGPSDTPSDGGGAATTPAAVSSQPESPQPESSGGAPSREPDGTGGTATSSSAAEQELLACIAYAEAYCRRAQQCYGLPENQVSASCGSVSFSCPDVVFSEGSTRTPEGLQACAEEIATFPCDAWMREERPACVTPGVLPAGAACAFQSQCASGTCSVDTQQMCGVCATEAGPDDDCTDPLYVCPAGSTCNDATARCEAIAETEPSPPPVAPDPIPSPQDGEECEPSTGCAEGLDCAGGPDGWRCTPYPTLGEDCSQARTCFGDSYCELDGLVCREIPGLGQACGVDGWTGGAGWCSSGLICRQESERVGTCVELPLAGEPCVTFEDEDGTRGYCADGVTCDLRLSPPLCDENGARVCVTDTDCGYGVCQCETAACELKICRRALDVSAACPEADAECRPGTSCIDGTCQAVGSLGLFEAACQ